VTATTSGDVVVDRKTLFIEFFKYPKAAHSIVAPGMSPTDGHMMMTMVPAETVRGGFAKVAVGLGMLGRFEHNPLVNLWRVQDAMLMFDRPTLWYVDGEPGDISVIHASIQCLSESIPFVTPISTEVLRL